jgi:hypothetical protein
MQGTDNHTTASMLRQFQSTVADLVEELQSNCLTLSSPVPWQLPKRLFGDRQYEKVYFPAIRFSSSALFSDSVTGAFPCSTSESGPFFPTIGRIM